MSLDPALLAAVVDTAACLICVFDRDGRAVQFNRACEDTSGYACSEVQGRRVVELLVPPEELDGVRAVDERLRAGERLVRHEAHWLTRDGRRRLIDWTSTVILDEDGEVDYVVATGIDVTEQREAERALEESEERFRLMVEHLPLITYRSAIDERSTPLWVSAQVEPILGHTPEEWLGNPHLLDEIAHPEDRERLLAEIAEHHDGGGVHRSEYRVLARDGRVVWLHDTSVIVRDEAGLPLYSQGYAIDVTERKRAEEALRESEERFRQLAENIDEAFILADPGARRALYLSPAFEAIWGRSPEEVSSDTTLLHECIHPEDRERVLAATSRVAAEPYDLEYRIVRPDGEVRWVHDRGFPVRGDDGEAHRAAGIAADVTGRKLAEDALHRRDAILESVGRAAERVLAARRADEAILALLSDLGAAMQVSRTYVFENTRDAAGALCHRRRAEWSGEGPAPQAADIERQGHAYFEGWADVLGTGGVIASHVRDLGPGAREHLELQDVKSIVDVPIFVGDAWWGFLGFVECREEREWSVAEIDALRAAAGMLGAAIERERAEAALRESEERFRALFDSAAIGIAVLDLDGRPVARNAAYQRILGYSDAELAEMPVAEFVHPEDRDRALQLFGELAAGQRERGRMEERCSRKDGSIAWVVVTASVARDVEGRPRFVIVTFEDVTEVRQAEEALRESEERFRTLFDSAPIGIGLFDLDGRTIARNAAYERILGYTAAELAAMPAAAFVHPEDRDEALEHFRELASGRREHDYLELRCYRKDGTLAWMLLSAAVVRGPAGRPRFVVATLQDASELKAADAALRESEERYRELFENANDLVYTHDLAGTITSVNRAAERVAGYSRAEALGLSILDLVAPDYREFAAGMIERKLAGSGSTVYELEIVAKDGRRVPLEVSSRLILEEGVPIGVQGVARDVTERRRGEALAHGQRRVLEVIARGAPLGDALDEIARLVEEQAPGRLCSILLYDADRDRLLPGAAPSLPQEYAEQIEAIGGLPVGPKSASCGTAAFRREPVSVTDAFTDPLWEDFRELAAAHDLRACWSTPILSTDTALLGTLSLYAREPVEPAPEDVELVGIAAHMASIAIARRQAEGRLVEAERRYRFLAEQLPMITYIDNLDAWSSTIYISPQVEEILGYTPDEWLADRELFSKVIHPDDRDRMLGQVAERNATGEPSGSEYRVIAKDGRVVWLREAEVVALDDEGNPLCAQGYLVDITELKEAEAALRESEERFREMAEAVDECFWLAGPGGDLIYVSPVFERIWGVPWTGSDALRETIHPADRQRVEPVFDGKVAAPFDVQYRIVRPDGAVRWVRDRCFHVRDDQGAVQRIAGIVMDITERKRENETRRQLEEQMRHVQKLESLGILAGGIAHDFNNLLMGVLGNAGLALAELPEDSPVRDKVDRIETAALRAAELTNQMLAYAGKGRFVVAPLDLSRLVEEMAHLLGTAISKKAVLRFDLVAELPAVESDATQLRQVVMNLITNASDALGEESGVVTVRTGVMAVDRAYLATTYLNEDLAEGSYVYVEVADTGCGMDEGTLARIFDPFFTTKFTGRGLGLAGVLGIVRAHGGAIRVDSEPGEGTTFRVVLPAAKTVWAEAPRETPSSETRRLSGIVLVVDDEDAVRAVARAALERSGFTVLTAGDGKEGIDVFREHAAEIGTVVLDMTMPVMGGREVLEELRRIRPGVRVVLSSGYTEEDATERLEGAPVAGFIQKPYRPAELVEKLRAVLAP